MKNFKQPEKKRKIEPETRTKVDKEPSIIRKILTTKDKLGEEAKKNVESLISMQVSKIYMMPSFLKPSMNYQSSVGFFQTVEASSSLLPKPVTIPSLHGVKKIKMEGDINYESPDYILLSHIVLDKEEKAKRMEVLRDSELQLMDVLALIRVEPAKSEAKEPSDIGFEKLDLSYLFNSPDITIPKKLKLIEKLCDNSDLLIPRLVLSTILINDKKLFPLEKNKEKAIKEYLTRKINYPIWSDKYKIAAEAHIQKKPEFDKVDFPSDDSLQSTKLMTT